MLKVLIGSIFISLFSSNAFAENCMVSDALKNKSCSVENFKARNQRELDDYLLNGKFKDGKLLNLEIGYNIEDKEINIATTCDLKISHERRLTAKQNGICLKASSIRFEGENELIADKKAPIEISAYNSIIIRESLIFTKGDLVISTSNFLPFEGEILISKESHLKASSIHITSKSNLIINSESKLKADDIILNSGNCEINEKNDRDNDDERDHDKSCKKFTPKFSYSGTCKTNPLPTDLKIAMTVSGNNSQSINFSVLGAPNTSVTNWKFDHSFESINSLAKQDFIYPGRHLAQAVVIGSTGYFRKVGQYINVSPTRFNKGQIAIFQFSGSKNAPNKIQAAIDMRNITLTKSSTDPELYFTEIDGDKVGLRNILIPHFQYQGKFTLNILPEISNPDEYINTYFNSILDKISSSNSTNPSVLQVNESIKLLLGEIKLKIYQLSLADRIKFANFLQANITSNPGRIVETKKFPIKSINILDIIMPSAKAANPLLQLIDLASAGNLRQFNSSNIGFDIAAGALVIVSLGSGVLCKPIWCRAAIGTIFLLTTASVVYSQTIEMDNIGDAHLPKPSTLYGEVVGKALSNQITSIRLRGTFIPVDSLPINQSPLVLSAINRAKNDNAYIAKANEYIDSFNSSLNFFGLSSPLGKIPLVTFPQPTVPGFLSPSYITSATIVDPLDGSASIQSHSKKDGSLVIRSDRSQIVKVKMAYTNNDLGIFQNIIVDVPIVVIPKAVISYTKSNLQVYLDSTDPQDQNVSGLTYIWDFGDGQTATTFSKYLSHTYAQDGTYTIGLKVLDSFGNISQTTIVVSVAAPARFTTINYTKQDLRVDLYAAGNFSDPNLPSAPRFFKWNFGDGTFDTSSGPSLYHIYNSPGTYTITLNVLDIEGVPVAESSSVNVFVYQPVATILSSPSGTVTLGDSFTYSISCDVDQSVFMETNVSYDFINYDFYLEKDLIPSCTGLGETGMSGTDNKSVHEITCQTNTFQNTSGYAMLVSGGIKSVYASNPDRCAYSMNSTITPRFWCGVIDQTTGNKYYSNYVDAVPIKLYAREETSCN